MILLDFQMPPFCNAALFYSEYRTMCRPAWGLCGFSQPIRYVPLVDCVAALGVPLSIPGIQYV